jgi:hypothetical protein
MSKITSKITIGNRIHNYSLEKMKGSIIRVRCKDANIDQDFLAEDVPGLIIDLPNLITAEKKYKDTQSDVVRFRISTKDKARIEKEAIKRGYDSVSDYIRHIALG